MTAAVLALQGAFFEHERMLESLGVDTFEIRQKKDLEKEFDALVLPGGESTVMGKLLRELELYEPLQRKILEGFPTLGTCAGLLLLAKEIDGGMPCFATMDVQARRNAYGRQLGSFCTEEEFGGVGKIPMTFIRAPYISKVSDSVEILAEVDGHTVAARQGKQLVCAFHPELTKDTSVHKYFLELAKR